MKDLGDICSLEFRHFPLSRHAYAHYAARSSFAAEKQGSFGRCMICCSNISRLYRWTELMNWLEALALIGKV